MSRRINNRLLKITLLLMLASSGMAGVAHADSTRYLIAQNRAGNTQAQLISSEQAADAARRATGGRVLGVKLKNGKRPVYRVKVLLNSERVRTVTVDASSGNVR